MIRERPVYEATPVWFVDDIDDSTDDLDEPDGQGCGHRDDPVDAWWAVGFNTQTGTFVDTPVLQRDASTLKDITPSSEVSPPTIKPVTLWRRRHRRDPDGSVRQRVGCPMSREGPEAFMGRTREPQGHTLSLPQRRSLRAPICRYARTSSGVTRRETGAAFDVPRHRGSDGIGHRGDGVSDRSGVDLGEHLADDAGGGVGRDRISALSVGGLVRKCLDCVGASHQHVA